MGERASRCIESRVGYLGARSYALPKLPTSISVVNPHEPVGYTLGLYIPTCVIGCLSMA